ncbi:MAG: HEPN domain-containing protein [Firmicutes bacterium]|nr:HEPN domain-containing protein [Bacillota bacterium]
MDSSDIWAWFDFADSDLEAAEHLLTLFRPRLEIICYHCQQAAEKYLKGYLLYKGVFPPKIHDLDALCKKCFEFDPTFQAILQECAALSDYGVQPRYPNEMLIEEHHMKKALIYAQQIKDFEPLQAIRRELEQELHNKNTIEDAPLK